MDRTHELRVEPNLLRACEIWAAAAEGGWTPSKKGLYAFGCAAGQRAFNQVFVTAPGLDADALRALTSRYEHGRFRLRMRDDLHEGVRVTLEAAGLQRQGGIPTMTFTGELDAADAGLLIEPVTNEARLAEHVRIVTEAFGWTPDTLGRIFTPKLLEQPDWAAWVGYADGCAVATAQLVVHENVAGLYYVATVKAARRKGYGDAITRHAIREGQVRGCDLVCLQASPDGRPVYERLGFSVIGEYVTYVPSEDA